MIFNLHLLYRIVNKKRTVKLYYLQIILQFLQYSYIKYVSNRLH